MGLIDGELIAIDGTKIKAQHSKSNYITPNGLSKKMNYFDEKIEQYLQRLEEVAQKDKLVKEPVSSIEMKIDKSLALHLLLLKVNNDMNYQ